MDHLAEFQTLLEKLLSPDNDIRKQAEDAYEEISKEQRASFLFLTAKSQEFNFEVSRIVLVTLSIRIYDRFFSASSAITGTLASSAQ